MKRKLMPKLKNYGVIFMSLRKIFLISFALISSTMYTMDLFKYPYSKQYLPKPCQDVLGNHYVGLATRFITDSYRLSQYLKPVSFFEGLDEDIKA